MADENQNSEGSLKLKEQIKTVEPNMVDKFGTKWYIDPGGSQYAQTPDQRGIMLVNTTVWVIEELDGSIRMCIVENNRVIYENYWVQQIGQEIDRLKAFKYANRHRPPL